MPGHLNIENISSGTFHSCMSTTSGQAYCSGAGTDGSLGSGTLADGTFVPVSGGLNFKSVTAGFQHSCGVTTAGEAFCWGTGRDGQLGNGAFGTDNVVTTPQPVLGGHSFATVYSGFGNTMHTCGLTTGGAAYCWGNNLVGQLGTGDLQGSTTPRAVTGGHTFVSMHSGGGSACAITTASKLYCWGDNSAGQIGDGSMTHRRSPVLIAAEINFMKVAIGASHTCALDADGAAYCWGSNGHGKLGIGKEHAMQNLSMVPLPVSGGHRFKAISAGGDHSCAVTFGGQAWCWGLAQVGQLGTVTKFNSTVPVKVAQQP
jgi:alpha-tubulin suppressor-like RCC1 family protein